MIPPAAPQDCVSLQNLAKHHAARYRAIEGARIALAELPPKERDYDGMGSFFHARYEHESLLSSLKKAEDAELSILNGFVERHPDGRFAVDSALRHFPRVILEVR